MTSSDSPPSRTCSAGTTLPTTRGTAPTAATWPTAITNWRRGASAWLALLLLLRGEAVRASGWIARCERLVDPSQRVAALGLLQVSRFLLAVGAGEDGDAETIGLDIEAIGRACGDPDVQTFGTLCCGEVIVYQHGAAAGLQLLDEAMLRATEGGLGPITTAIIYSAVIEMAMRVLDIERAGRWTDELRRWTERQVGLVPFTGACHVHRCQIMTAAGRWPEAADEAQRACVRLAEVRHPAYGLACYERGEVHRLRGDLDAADAAYRSAAAHGYEPVPGLALLMAATGDVAGAGATIRRMLAEPGDRLQRPLTLAAAVGTVPRCRRDGRGPRGRRRARRARRRVRLTARSGDRRPRSGRAGARLGRGRDRLGAAARRTTLRGLPCRCRTTTPAPGCNLR